jgi:hypothetical protein
LNIIEICDHTHRDADRAARPAINAQTKIIQRETIFVAGAGKAYIQFHT